MIGVEVKQIVKPLRVCLFSGRKIDDIYEGNP